jgi:hypothetical protein
MSNTALFCLLTGCFLAAEGLLGGFMVLRMLQRGVNPVKVLFIASLMLTSAVFFVAVLSWVLLYSTPAPGPG